MKKFKLFKLLVLVVVLMTSINTAMADVHLYNGYVKIRFNGNMKFDGNYYEMKPEGPNKTVETAAQLGTLTGNLEITDIKMKINTNYWTNSSKHTMWYNIDGSNTNKGDYTINWGSSNGDGYPEHTGWGNTVARSTDPSGNHSVNVGFYSDFEHGSGWEARQELKTYYFSYTVMPPSVDSIYVTPTGALAGDGSAANPYIVAYNGTLQLEIMDADQAHEDPNSSAQYSIDNSNWGTATANTVKTISGIQGSGDWMVYARFHNGTASLTGTQKGRRVYYKAESRYNITATASPVAGGTVTPTTATLAGQYSGGDITASPYVGYRFNGWTRTSGSGTFVDASSAETKFKPTAASTVQAAFVRTYAYVEGRFRVYNEDRDAITTTYSSGSWDNDSRNIPMTYDSENHRFYLRTYMTLAELSAEHGSGCDVCTPYFYIKTTTTTSSTMENVVAYRPASGTTIVNATRDNGVDVASSGAENSIWFNNSSEAGYVVLYFDQEKVWYELEPAIFTAATDADWNDASNWSPAKVPNSETDVVLTKPVEVDMAHAAAKSIVVYNDGSSNTGKLTVKANMGLEVEGTITKTTNGSSYGATAASDIILESDDTGNATLIFNNSNSCQATVYMYSKGWTDGVEDTGDWNWQYIGVPVTDATRLNDYYGGYMYEWNTSGKKWDDVTNTSATLTTFKAYSVTYPTTEDDLHTYEIDGSLAATTSQAISVAAGQTVQAAANSWTAPIRINDIESENWEPATIFLFNTGYGTATKAGSRYAPSTYLPIPVSSAPYLDEYYIAPMQGFLFKNTKSASAGTITLSYANAVRTDGSEGIVAGPMHAPQRLAEEKPVVLKIYVSGTENDDRVVLLERSDFSRDFDNGWDGEKFQVNAVKTAPRLFAINETGGKEAVSAIPEFEGTVIGFRPGTDTDYKITFEYDGEETLYLKDTKNDVLTLIDNESEYNFTSNGENEDSRFLIYKAPAITTGTDHVGDGNSIHKQMINGQLYIIRDGQIYDMLGKTIQ